MKIGVVFDNRRKDTTGNYILKSLVKRPELDVFYVPTAYWKHCKNECDLYVVVDDGVPADWPTENKCPIVYWAIDVHLDPGFRVANAKKANVDHVFSAQKNRMHHFSDEGISVSWLPLACDISVHANVTKVEKEYDVCAVCHTDAKWSVMNKRIDFFDAMFKKFPNFFYGQRYLEKCTEVYGKSKIVLNQSVLDDVNMRCFEALCSGSLLLTNYIGNNGFEDIFTANKNIITFDCIESAIEKAEYYLSDDDLREKIALDGQKLVMENHTYDHRCDSILYFAEKKGWIQNVPYLKKTVAI